MSTFSWFTNFFGISSQWTDDTVVQYQGDGVEYSYDKHIEQLFERRPSLFHRQRELVDAQIVRLRQSMALQLVRTQELARHREAQRNKQSLSDSQSKSKAVSHRDDNSQPNSTAAISIANFISDCDSTRSLPGSSCSSSSSSPSSSSCD